MTESININSLADHSIWSTIKTLPATLPEPSSKVQGPSPKHICPRTSAAGSIAGGGLGVTEAVWVSVTGFLVAGHRMRVLGARTSVLAVMDRWSQCWIVLLKAY